MDIEDTEVSVGRDSHTVLKTQRVRGTASGLIRLQKPSSIVISWRFSTNCGLRCEEEDE